LRKVSISRWWCSQLLDSFT